MSLKSHTIGTIVDANGNDQVALIGFTNAVLDCNAPGFDQAQRDAAETEFWELHAQHKDRIDTAILMQV